MQQNRTSPQMVIIDTDIGDDIDDAFALALALKSPELRVLGVKPHSAIQRCAHAC